MEFPPWAPHLRFHRHKAGGGENLSGQAPACPSQGEFTLCGICGFAAKQIEVEPEAGLIAAMTARLTHRGPDDAGLLVRPGIGLGFRRLSIIGVDSGAQPLRNEDGTVAVVCNGEIYNHRELAAELTARGHRFAGGSDCEVIVHLYEEYGVDFVDRLRGMFGLALWDGRRRELLLARDRLGIKPLHYAVSADGLYFASEQKAILASPSIRRELDPTALWELFALGFVPGERTLFASIRRLRPGEMLRFRHGELSRHTYWRLNLAETASTGRQIPVAEWAEQIHDKLAECVDLHLRSDVPVAAWLSPGLDSSSVVALASRQGGGVAETFTLACEDPTTDETARQPILTDYPGFAGIPNTRTVLRAADLELLPEAVYHCEDPFTSGAEIARLRLAKAAGQRYKVVLTGEGADEALGGYPWFRAEKFLGNLAWLPAPLRRALAATPFLRHRWPGGCNIVASLGTSMSFEQYRAFVGPPTFAGVGIELFSADLLRCMPRGCDSENLRDGGRIRPGPSRFSQLQAMDFLYRLPDCVVQHLDRMSMACGLEARVPFLDHEFIELCARLPPAVMLCGFREKHVLRQAMRGILPAAICARRKRAMSAPYANWLRAPLPDFARAALAPAALAEGGYFELATVQRLLAEHRRGQANHGRLLLGVLGIQLWDAQLRRMSRASAPKTGEAG